jgi:SAM-dependent methyltransferase
MQLQECPCGLLWVDARVDAETSARHFDRAYRDDEYYRTDRAAVFSHLAAIVDRHTRRGGQVLDVGGAGGQFATVLRERRPDLAITVQDVSGAKIVEAVERGFVGLVGTDWMSTSEQYHTIILSDSIYYEPNLPQLWAALARLRAPGGLIILRVPNRIPIVRLSSWWQRHSNDLPIDVRGHNPDHLVICSPRYLTGRLRAIGCTEVRVLPTPVGEGHRVPGLYAAARLLHRLTSVCLTPSMVIIGR